MSEFVESALHHYRDAFAAVADTGLVVREYPAVGHLNLRGDPEDLHFLSGVETVLGLALPEEPGTTSIDESTVIYWLGPDEWLVNLADLRLEDTQARLRQQLQCHFSVVDISGGQTKINISGDRVQEVLQKSCVYDFHPDSFGPGRCVQTSFAKATALVARVTDGSFDMVVRRSYADYLARWLLDVARSEAF